MASFWGTFSGKRVICCTLTNILHYYGRSVYDPYIWPRWYIYLITSCFSRYVTNLHCIDWINYEKNKWIVMAIHINNVCSEKQAVKGEALSAPQCREGSQEKKSKGRWCPPPSLFPSLQWHFPVALWWKGVAAGRRTTWLPRWPVWDSNPLSRMRKSLAQEGLPSWWPPVWTCGIG